MALPGSFAESRKFRRAISAISKYLDSHFNKLTPELLEAGAEIKRRIRRMENDANRLIKINNSLIQSEMPDVKFDPATDTLSIRRGDQTTSIKLNRADPKKPISIAGSAATGAYKAGSLKAKSYRLQLTNSKWSWSRCSNTTTSNAFRITKLVQQVSGRKKYHCLPITSVRNKLIEHPATGSIYSFGFGTRGPTIKPISRGNKDWTDSGLISNTEALLNSLLEVFENDT